MFIFVRKFQTVFCSGCPILHFTAANESSCRSTSLLAFGLSMFGILVILTVYLLVILNRVSLITLDVYHLFICLFAILYVFFGEVSVWVLSHCLIKLFIF